MVTVSAVILTAVAAVTIRGTDCTAVVLLTVTISVLTKTEVSVVVVVIVATSNLTVAVAVTVESLTTVAFVDCVIVVVYGRMVVIQAAQ